MEKKNRKFKYHTNSQLIRYTIHLSNYRKDFLELERKDSEEYTVVRSETWHKSLGHRTQHVHQFKEQSMTGVPETGQYSLL